MPFHIETKGIFCLMTAQTLDELDRRILSALADDARMSLKALSARISLSSPSTSERLKRLEERGVIRGFLLDIHPDALGYTLQAMVRIRPLPGNLHAVQRLIEDIPQVVECDKVTGEDCFFARLHVRSIGQLDEILDRIADKSETHTAIVKSQPVRRRLLPLE